VQCCDDLCAVTDRGGDPLDRAAAYVADRENAGQIGFEHTSNVAAGTDEALGVECDAGAREPVGIGVCADEQEQMAARQARSSPER